MSTPISGSSGTGLLNSLLSSNASGHAGKTKSNQGAAAGAAQQQGPDAALSAALAAEIASVNQLSQVFTQAAQGATTVDPTTGQVELSTSSSSQLTSALTSFLEQSGFSQQQADAAANSFASQLAKGGPVSLDASFDDTSSVSSSVSSSYGSTTMSASSVAVNERSGSVAINFDPTTGKVSISLQEQQLSAVTSITQISSPNALSSIQLALLQPLAQPLGLLSLLPGDSHGHGTGSDGNSNGAGNNSDQNLGGQSGGSSSANPGNAANTQSSDPTADAASVLNSLIAGLGQATLHDTHDAKGQLGRAAQQASQQQDGDGASTTNGDTTTGDTANGTESASGSISVSIGFTQTLSLSLLDLSGHGTTLFKRPDGSTGAMSFDPTHVEA